MTVSNSDLPPRQQVRDWLFAQLGGQLHRNAAFDAIAARIDDGRSLDVEPDVRLSDALPQSAPSEPPALRGPEDLRVANEWVQKERQRLEAYTRNQLASLQQQHKLLVSQNYLNEQNWILRSQELARKEKLVLAQGEALQQQSQDLARREEDLVGQLAQWRDAQKELAQIQQVAEQVRLETADQRSLLAVLQTETAALQHSKQTAQADLANLMTAIEQQCEARPREEATFRARQMQLEQRLGEADRVERACQQRLAELADFEANLRCEFEEQERKLIREQQELEGLWETTRRERKLLAGEQANLNRRQHAVEEAEKAGRQRQQEQDAFQESLEKICQSLAQHHAVLEQRAEELDIRERLLGLERENRTREMVEQR